MTRGALLALLVALASACGNDGAPPARLCTSHDQCDDDYLCGPAGTCVAASSCEGDGDCCPGALCFNGWCRPTVACDAATRPCEGLGTTCEAGQCVPVACSEASPCPGMLQCTGGRCLSGLPCDGACGAGAACDLASGRCLAASCPAVCPAGQFPLAQGVPLDPLTCGVVPCACAPLPAVPPGQPGVDGRLLLAGGEPVLLSYEPSYGDLVLSRFPPVGRADLALDGVPLGVSGEERPDYRAGSVDPGPDRGRRPAVSLGPDGVAIDVVYRDEDSRTLRFARVDAPTGAVLLSSRIPVVGDAGRYSCLARRAGGRVAGLAFTVVEGAGETRLTRFEAPGIPGDAAAWEVVDVLATQLPPRSEAPCGGTCGLTEQCARTPSGDRCGSAPLLAAGGCDCGRHEVCLAETGGAAACYPRVYPPGAAGDLPFGRGLFVSCATDASGELVAAWYDDEAGALVAGRWPFDGGSRIAVDGADGGAVGTHAAIAVGPGGKLGIAYRDEGEGVLWVAVGSWPGPWERSAVHRSGPDEDVGAWPAVAWSPAGELLVAYGDAVGGGVWLARRDTAGCWGRARVFGGHHAYIGLAVDATSAWVSALSYRFDEQLLPHHGPVIGRVTPPVCGAE